MRLISSLTRKAYRSRVNPALASIMLSTIVLCEIAHWSGRIDPAERLVRTLSSLIRANVEGLLGDVAIAGPARHGLGVIADHAGCCLIEADAESEWFRRAIEAARGPELFILRSGFAPQAGFIEEAGDFLRAMADGGSGSAPAALLRAAPESFAERLFPRAAPAAGLIAPRDQCIDKSAEKFAALVQFIAPATALRTPARRIG
jgi:hypothetical protein